MVKRALTSLIQKSKKSILLLGPRQVGKSTLLNGLNPDLTINLADESEYKAFLESTDELKDRIAFANPRTIFIDEIQRIPELLNTIQVLIDNNKGRYIFYLSGSSARKLKRGTANLLPGRIFVYRLGPISCLEVDYKLDTKKALELGTLPEPYFEADRNVAEKLLRSYTATYLHEEILQETLIRDLKGFTNFLKIVCENSGLVLDFSKLATKSKVSRSAARRYFDILIDSMLCEEVAPYIPKSDGNHVDYVKHSKFYLFDVGVTNSGIGLFQFSSERKGLLFEHLFFNQLKNVSYCLDKEFDIYYLRTHSGIEIDFVLRNKSGSYLLIELKSSEPDSNEIKKVLKASEAFPEKHDTFIACIKCQAKKKLGVTILPWQALIKKIVDWV